jgi:hypothetical protein
MADWYINHLYRIYVVQYLEKFSRYVKPEWYCWYNRRNQSFNYEIWDSTLNDYYKRILPQKFPNVAEMGLIHFGTSAETGICIYREDAQIKWIRVRFGTNSLVTDDIIISTGIFTEIVNATYLYVHEVKKLIGGRKVGYIIVNDSNKLKIYVIYSDNPTKLYPIDLTEVSGYFSTAKDMRLSKPAFEFSGEHGIIYMNEGDIYSNYDYCILHRVDVTYDPNHNDLMFKTNIPAVLWWRNRPNPDSYPPFDGGDQELSILPYEYTGSWSDSGIEYVTNQVVFYNTYNYKCTSDHTSSALNNPLATGAPWVQFEWFLTPLGTAGYSYSVGSIASDTLEYEYVNWRTDVDREWFVGSNLIIVRTGGGFAFILFI